MAFYNTIIDRRKCITIIYTIHGTQPVHITELLTVIELNEMHSVITKY